MTVKKRLLGSIFITIAGLLIMAAISVYVIFNIRSEINILTGQSTPLQVKTLELQQAVDRLSADLMRLGLSSDWEEIKRLSGIIEGHIKSMEDINKDMQRLGMKSFGADTAVFENVQKTVTQSVLRKLEDLSLFEAETSVLNTTLKEVERTTSEIRDKTGKITEEAAKGVREAQNSDQRLNSVIKKVLTAQAKLKEIEVILAEIETVKNRFRLSPYKERMKAVTDSIRTVNYEEGDPTVILDMRETAANIFTQFASDGNGLITLKANMLSNKEEEGAYLSLKKSVLKTVDTLSLKVTEIIDPFEVQMVKDGERIEWLYNFQNTVGQISDTGNAINLDTKDLAAKVRLVMLSDSETELQKAETVIKALQERIRLNVEKLKELVGHIEESEMLKDVNTMSEVFSSANFSISEILNARRRVLTSEAAMRKALDNVKTISSEQSKRGEQQVKIMTEKQMQVVHSVGKTVKVSLTIMVAVSLVVLGAVVITNGKAAKSIMKPLKTTEEIISTVEKGDLTRKIGNTGNDEIGQMCRSFNGLIDKLRSAISHISGRSQMINSYAENIAKTVDGQAAFSMQLSSSVTEISSTMEELSASSSQIAEYTNSVVQVANKSWNDTKKGAAAVETITTKMNEINLENQHSIGEILELGKKSKEITKVMVLINKIADQTKLIAFNAAIEASSAGEAGDRFGVVAVEIRRLADSVMESTGEIESKINQILEAVNRLIIASEKTSKSIQEGVDYATQTVKMLIDIVKVTEETNKSAKQISLSTQQQKTANSQVAVALREIVEGAAQMSSSIGQINTISKEMAKLSDDLKGLVEEFKLGEG
ncbi:MAG: HAMP domain-containing protein [Candidatus Tectomicrobia bacterium]|uniref:HAMP domain-containing protein n=1 Tax=Tectimicrobiota bacterium TaxID=2528274 RepID=A0A933GKG6_UNCTE|nr:HAMP domain-containing protein [Candidatus Tectomicrobia bacterium]